jgi:hypothetical protein
MVNLKKIMIPGTEIICSCCDRLADDNGVTQVFANSWYHQVTTTFKIHFTNYLLAFGFIKESKTMRPYKAEGK